MSQIRDVEMQDNKSTTNKREEKVVAFYEDLTV